MENKICSKCKQYLSVEKFYKRSDREGLRSQCKDCEMKYNRSYLRKNPDKAKDFELRKNFGITMADKLSMLKDQNFRCAACGSTEHKGRHAGDTGWPTDHDHKTGKVRGLLCNPCNRTLGQCEEDLHRLVALTAYLAKHTTSSLSELAAV